MINETLCRFRPPESGALLIWEITNLCNLECLHCCNNSGPTADISNEISTKVAIATAKKLHSLNITEVYFSGGEPLTRKDFFNILQSIDTTKVSVYVATNGTLITEEMAMALSTSGLKRMTISLDGFNERQHNKLRNKNFAFQKTIQGIKNCVKFNIPVRISGVITSDNINDIDTYIKLVSSLGVEALVIHTLVPVGRASDNMELINKSSAQDILTRAVARARKKFPSLAIDHSLSDSDSLAKKGCGGGISLIHITHDGDISPCSWLYKIDKDKFTLGNLKSVTLERALKRNNELMGALTKSTPNCPISSVTKES